MDLDGQAASEGSALAGVGAAHVCTVRDIAVIDGDAVARATTTSTASRNAHGLLADIDRSPIDVAHAVLDLAIDESRCSTGQVLTMDSGHTPGRARRAAQRFAHKYLRS